MLLHQDVGMHDAPVAAASANEQTRTAAMRGERRDEDPSRTNSDRSFRFSERQRAAVVQELKLKVDDARVLEVIEDVEGSIDVYLKRKKHEEEWAVMDSDFRSLRALERQAKKLTMALKALPLPARHLFYKRRLRGRHDPSDFEMLVRTAEFLQTVITSEISKLGGGNRGHPRDIEFERLVGNLIGTWESVTGKFLDRSRKAGSADAFVYTVLEKAGLRELTKSAPQAIKHLLERRAAMQARERGKRPRSRANRTKDFGKNS
jgi:hypothetical protein